MHVDALIVNELILSLIMKMLQFVHGLTKASYFPDPFRQIAEHQVA